MLVPYDELSDEELLAALTNRGLPQSGGRPLAVPSAQDSPVVNNRRRGTGSLAKLATVGADRTEALGYSPLDSVWYGEEDAELIEQLLRFYPRREPTAILDTTVNGARFWRGSHRRVIGLDIDLRHRPTICADNNAMPFAAASFDVLVYDPPHIPNQGADRSKDFTARFGLGARSAKENGYSFSHTFPGFMVEAWRVLMPEGVLLCKIVDYIHNHRYQWAHLDLIKAGQDVGFTACDCIIKIRKGPIVDPKWKTAHHSRRQHAYWIVFRKSTKCE